MLGAPAEVGWLSARGTYAKDCSRPRSDSGSRSTQSTTPPRQRALAQHQAFHARAALLEILMVLEEVTIGTKGECGIVVSHALAKLFQVRSLLDQATRIEVPDAVKGVDRDIRLPLDDLPHSLIEVSVIERLAAIGWEGEGVLVRGKPFPEQAADLIGHKQRPIAIPRLWRANASALVGTLADFERAGIEIDGRPRQPAYLRGPEPTVNQHVEEGDVAVPGMRGALVLGGAKLEALGENRLHRSLGMDRKPGGASILVASAHLDADVPPRVNQERALVERKADDALRRR